LGSLVSSIVYLVGRDSALEILHALAVPFAEAPKVERADFHPERREMGAYITCAVIYLDRCGRCAVA
jgi:hypothetical protein